MCVHLIFSGGQGRALVQNTIKVRYITIWYSAGVLTLCETTGGVLILCETNLLIVETANTILVWVPSGRAVSRVSTAVGEGASAERSLCCSPKGTGPRKFDIN